MVKKYLDDSGQFSAPAAGAAAPAYTLPAATAAKLGGVKQGAAVANVVAGADDAHTVTALLTGVNALLKSLQDAGVIAK